MSRTARDAWAGQTAWAERVKLVSLFISASKSNAFRQEEEGNEKD